MKEAVLGIGTNIGDRKQNIDDAVRAISLLPDTEVDRISDIYETAPWGYAEQDNFYNACIKIRTKLSPNGLLGACLGIEAAFGRKRSFKNGPRIIDIDLLMYEDTESETPELMLPHPLIADRAFVLVPLKDVLPDLKFGKFDFNNDYNMCDKSGINAII